MSPTHAALSAVILLSSHTAFAGETPAFDRPGIAFSTGTLSAGTYAWEQGLPDFEHHAGGSDRSTLYSANTLIRTGLSEHIELQVGVALYNYRDARHVGTSLIEHGFGDSSLALKWALPTTATQFSWAALGVVSFPSGETPFRASEPQYDLGTTLGLDINPRVSTALYVNATQFDGDLNLTVSPTLAYAFDDRTSLFVEAGAYFNHASEDAYVAGGGITWMLTPILHLDASLNFGLNDDSPDLSGGMGFSVFIE